MRFKERRTIAQQIAEHISIKIMRGAYGAEGRLPSTRDLAKEVGVNPNTVSQSFQILQEQGIIRAERGVGYFVEEGAQGTLHQQERRAFFEEQIPEFKAEVERLGIALEDVIEALKN